MRTALSWIEVVAQALCCAVIALALGAGIVGMFG